MGKRGLGVVGGAVCLAVAALCAMSAKVAADVRPCVGDCDGNRQVTIDELVRGVSIALIAQPVSICPAFDRNQNDAVTIDELITGVNSALRGCFAAVRFRGVCLRPGPSGLVPCPAGTTARVSVCLDRSRCLLDPLARRVVGSGTAGSDGTFALVTSDEAIVDALLVLESDVDVGVVYRDLIIGPSSDGAVFDGLAIDPRSEAAARLIAANGAELFSNVGLSELLDVIRAALAAVDFSGLSPLAAADLAATIAGQDPTVQTAIAVRRFTPTATKTSTVTRTSTATSTVTATTTSTATATLTPTVTATPSSTSTVSSTPTQSATATITATTTPSSTPTATLPPLNLAVEVNPDPVRPGETVEVSVTVTNTGGSVIGPVMLETVLPMSIDSFNDTLASGTGRCGVNQINTCNPGSTLTWHFIGNLAPGEGITLRVPPIVAAGTPNGTPLQFTATAMAGELSVMRSYTAVVQSGTAANPFDLALTQDREPVPAGALLTYTATFGFRAVVGQADSTLQIHPPAGTTFVDASDGGAPNANGDVEWMLGTLTPGDGGNRRLTVRIGDAVVNGALLEAQATIARSDAGGTKRANAANRVASSAPLRLAIAPNPDPARPGDSIDVEITVTNPSDAPVSATLDVVVPDLVDTVIDGHTMGGGVCGPFSLGNPCERRSRIRWTLTVPPRDGVTVRLDPVVSMATPGGAVIPLQARLVNTQGSSVVSARRAIHVDASANWDLAVDEDRDPVGPSDAYSYRLTVRHRPADAVAKDATLELTLPDGVTVLDAGDGTLDGRTVRWVLGPLGPGELAFRELTVGVDPTLITPTVLAAETVVRAADGGFDATRNRTITRAVIGTPLLLSLEANPDPVRPGEVLETQLTVTNVGSTNLNGIGFEARMPENTDAFFASLSSGASCSAQTLQCAPREVVRWTIPQVPPGGAATVRVPPIVTAGTPDGTLLHLFARAADIGGGRNAVISRTFTVATDPPFALALTDSIDAVIPGHMVTYTVHYGRLADVAAVAAVLRVDLPPSVFFVSASDGGTALGDHAAEWDLGAIAPGEGGSRQLTAVVDTVPLGTPLHAVATIRDGEDASSAARANVVTAAASAILALSVTAAPDPVQPGAPVTVSLSVTNTGSATVANVSVEGIVPPEANAFQDTTTTGGGICGPFGSNACAPRQRVLWTIASIGAGQTVTVTMPPTIRANVAPGSVVRFVGRLQQNISTPPVVASDAVTVQGAMQ